MSNKMTAYTQTDNEFYPTPQSIIDKMLSGIDFQKVGTILEPSAGKGDIADVLKKRLASAHWRWNDKAVDDILDCVEIDPNLRHILTGKGYRVVHDDFLTFRTHKKYDLIVMNPPFANGDLHLLKALELMRDGGTIYGSRRKGWLPPSYGKKAYKDMTQEEKTVIDDFQGAEKYEKVLQRSDYYLVSEMPQLLMIGAENLDERERKSI